MSGARQSWCSVCRRTFLTDESFDIHRGIRRNHRKEDGQDLGRCLSDVEMFQRGVTFREGSPSRYGLAAEWALVDRMAMMREVRA